MVIFNILKKEVFYLFKSSPFEKSKILKFAQYCTQTNGNKNEMKFDIGVGSTIALSQFNHLATDPKKERLIKLCLLEIESAKQLGKLVPDYISETKFEELLSLSEPLEREKYLRYLYKVESANKRDILKKQQNKIVREKKIEQKLKERVNETHLIYGNNFNSIFYFIRNQNMNGFINHIVSKAVLFENPLVFDFGFEDEMVKREWQHTCDQLILAHASNQEHKRPFHMVFCNAKPEGQLQSRMQKGIGNISKDNCLITTTQQSYLDLYPRNKIIYLSPDAEEPLHEFDHDAVYIIGAFVDKVGRRPVTLAKAKKENIRRAKLPLEHYIRWGSGAGKSLTLNQMMDIMLDLRASQKMAWALRHVPLRKHLDYQIQKQENLFKKQFSPQ